MSSWVFSKWVVKNEIKDSWNAIPDMIKKCCLTSVALRNDSTFSRSVYLHFRFTVKHPLIYYFYNLANVFFVFSHETYPFSICNLIYIILNIYMASVILWFMWNYVLKFAVYNGILIHLSGGIHLVVRHWTLKEA